MRTKLTKDRMDRIFDSLKNLEEIGIQIRDFYCSDKLIKEMREANLLNFNAEFVCFLDKTEIPKKIIRNKGKNFEGMVIGINIRKSD